MSSSNNRPSAMSASNATAARFINGSRRPSVGIGQGTNPTPSIASSSGPEKTDSAPAKFPFLSKAEIQTVMSTNLAPKSGTIPNQSQIPAGYGQRGQGQAEGLLASGRGISTYINPNTGTKKDLYLSEWTPTGWIKRPGNTTQDQVMERAQAAVANGDFKSSSVREGLNPQRESNTSHLDLLKNNYDPMKVSREESYDSLMDSNGQLSAMTTSTSNCSSAGPFPQDLIPGANNDPSISTSTIEVSKSAYQLPSPQFGRKSSSKLVNQYVLADGSVVMGKGLGRGRPGVKRGSKTSETPEDVQKDPNVASIVSQTSPSIKDPGSHKRKRSGSAVTTTSRSSSRESTPEYNPTATQTRSGRQTQKPVLVTTNSSTNASPATKRQSTAPAFPTPTTKAHPKIKRKIYRGREQFALCEHCLRGNGPPGNAIVFCDACNKCWHQRCHDPQIPKQIVTDSKAEWFCSSCDRILHGKKKNKPPVSPVVKIDPVRMPSTPMPPVLLNGPQFGPPYVGASALTLSQRREYLKSLDKERLVDMVLRAADLAPHLPIFESPLPPPTPIPQVVQGAEPQFASSYVTPVDKTAVSVQHAETQDDDYDDIYDEHAMLYPKAGEGVKLPPDSVDLHMLLEGPECKTFSHWVRGMDVKRVVEARA